MELVDTHCHLYFQRYNHDRQDVLRRARAAGVQRIIVPAIDLESCKQAIKLARSDAAVYAAVGIHPNSGNTFGDSSLEDLRALAADPAVVALGEIGLDYYRDKCPKPRQWRAFEAQLSLAAELELPAIIHNREASGDLMSIVENWAPAAPAKLRGRLGVMHSFSAPWKIAQSALDLGFFLGFTGPVTFKNADGLREVARRAPLDRLLIETDGPFLAPHPKRGKRNEPAYVQLVNNKLAELHGIHTEEMASRTTRNAERLFALPSV